jgi:membrane protease YdiL (CAAX protease family)
MWLWAAALAAAVLCLLSPWKSALGVGSWGAFLPVVIVFGHVLTSFSYVLTSLHWRRGWGLWKSSWIVYGANRSWRHVLTAIPVAVFEELLFRCAGIGLFCFFVESPLAVLATSTIFALAHVRPSRRFRLRHFIDSLLLGLVLGTTTVLTSSVYPAIVLHGTRNYILSCLLVSKNEKPRK